MTKVLILGSEGGLGQAFLEVYRDQNPVGMDRNEIDIADEVQVMDVIGKFKPNVVINCAAYTNVDGAEQDRGTAETINGYAPGYIATACNVIDAVLVHFSTGMVFDGRKEAGYNEDDVPDPVNAYGQSKLLGEMELQKNLDSFYIIRSAWLFGQTKSGKRSFIELMLQQAKMGGEARAVNDEFGTPTYDLDLAQATRALVEEKKTFGIYHLINSGIASRYDWTKEIYKIRGLSTHVKPVKANEFPVRAAKRPKYEILNNTKFLHMRPWQEALKEFLTP